MTRPQGASQAAQSDKNVAKLPFAARLLLGVHQMTGALAFEGGWEGGSQIHDQ